MPRRGWGPKALDATTITTRARPQQRSLTRWRFPLRNGCRRDERKWGVTSLLCLLLLSSSALLALTSSDFPSSPSLLSSPSLSSPSPWSTPSSQSSSPSPTLPLSSSPLLPLPPYKALSPVPAPFPHSFESQQSNPRPSGASSAASASSPLPGRTDSRPRLRLRGGGMLLSRPKGESCLKPRRYEDVVAERTSWRSRTSRGTKVVDSDQSEKEQRQQLPPNLKFVVVTGGVLSGIGKGVTASSIGVVLKMMHRKPTAIKIDPYLNIDAGTMSPLEHGEVYVLEDGGETDLDLGNYERFMDVKLTNSSNLTTGKIYRAVIEAERKGEYLGKTVQVIPHVTGAIRDWIHKTAKAPIGMSGGIRRSPDICVIELGGTVGDIESMPFLEAIRELQLQVGRENVLVVHVSLIPEIGGEQKTKPTQHSVQKMREIGIYPDVLVARSKTELTQGARMKLSSFCHVSPEHIIAMPDLNNIYHIPHMLVKQGLHRKLSDQLKLRVGPLDRSLLNQWIITARNIDNLKDKVYIALVGKYTRGSDTYHSVVKALLHASVASKQKLEILWIDSTHLEQTNPDTMTPEAEEAWRRLKMADGLVVPGGFGQRALEGMINAITYARTNRVPFLGICLGMQLAVIEYARSVLGRPRAFSTEFHPNLAERDRAVIFMPEGDVKKMGGTMRLGVRTTKLNKDSISFGLYGFKNLIEERHRHRYEVNPAIVPSLEGLGLRFVGKDAEKGDRMEVVELSKEAHPYFVATQYHPEFNSRHHKPSPPFYGLLFAARNSHRDTNAKTSSELSELR